jgi:hypothetical protein
MPAHAVAVSPAFTAAWIAAAILASALPGPFPVLSVARITASSLADRNVAVTDSSALIVTVQVPVPEQPAPDQPANVEPESGLAVSVTIEPTAKLAEHVPPQSIPDGELVTVPEPNPFLRLPVQNPPPCQPHHDST